MFVEIGEGIVKRISKMKKRICEQCKGEFTPIPVNVPTVIACPHQLRDCGEKKLVGNHIHWIPKTYLQLPTDE